MTYNFDAYLNSVKRNIKNKKLHATICAELESHLQDSADFYVEIGYDEETANRKALEDMGEPTTVGESMAKLHKLSVWQKFLFSGFLFVAVLKFLDIFSVNSVVTGWLTQFILMNQPKDAFMLSGEIVSLLITVTAGIAITLYTKRKSPATASIVILLLEVPSLWCFSSVVWMTIKGNLDEYLQETVALTAVDYTVITISAVLIFSALLIPAICVIRAIGKPFFDSRKLKKNVKIFTVSFALVLSAVYLGIFAYVDRKDKEQFELYSRVVADMCDLCMEKGRITADDFEEVKERFDYLEIKEIDLNDYDIEYNGYYGADKYYCARIGDGLMINSYLQLATSSSGSFMFGAEADRLMYTFDLTLRYFKISRYINYKNRWEGSYDVASYISEFIERAQPGDSVDDYLMKVKETSSDFSYFYYAGLQQDDEYYMNSATLESILSDSPETYAEERYTTQLDMSGFFGQWYYYITADDGKFVSARDMSD
ncbi:MAG: hypothetical protein IIX16_04230 [Clostridia bacterium]|nr:hypothetical protein [Clostridia bacterium]